MGESIDIPRVITYFYIFCPPRVRNYLVNYFARVRETFKLLNRTLRHLDNCLLKVTFNAYSYDARILCYFILKNYNIFLREQLESTRGTLRFANVPKVQAKIKSLPV